MNHPGLNSRAINFLLISVGLCLFVLVLSCKAQDLVASFDAANKLYEQGKYSEAAAGYEQILKVGRVSGALYYNLGNAWFKAGQLGRAIDAYEKAKTLNPRDPDLIANLRFARNQVQGPTFAPGRASLWLGKLSLNEWTLMACAAAWLWMLLLSLAYLRPSLRPVLKGWSLATVLATILACTCLGLDYYRQKVQPTAVVIANSAVMHQAPLSESPGPISLSNGAEVRVLDRKDEWLQVTTDPRRIGWLRRDEVALPGTN
jgi:tetratricopeptide (TPR) repeat protein